MILEEDNTTPCCIRSFEKGTLELTNRERYHRSVIITPKQTVIDWRPSCAQDIQAADLHPLLDHRPDVILLGSGEQFLTLQPELLIPFHTEGIGIECMNTAAACRCFMALTSEQRNVLAALIIH